MSLMWKTNSDSGYSYLSTHNVAGIKTKYQLDNNRWRVSILYNTADGGITRALMYPTEASADKNIAAFIDLVNKNYQEEKLSTFRN